MPMQYKVPPFQHQLNAIERSKEMRDLALFWEMGTGKTAAVIHILRAKFNERKTLRRTLILAPLVTLKNWKEEFKKHSNIDTQDVVVLSGTGKKKTQEIMRYHAANKILILNYEALINGEIQRLILEWRPSILVCDESHLCKNYNSKRSKIVAQIADKCEHRYLLTGTPILNSPLDLYMQFRILDKGELFGENYFAYRARYFYDANAGWAHKHNHFPNWQPRIEKFDELNTLIYTKAIRVIKAECLDLPPLITQNIEVELSPEQKRLYKEMERDFVTYALDEKACVATTALTKALRLMQIVSGHVVVDKGELIELAETPREKVTRELLQELVPSHKVILWCAFVNDYRRLERICQDLNIKYCMLTGEQSQAQKDQAMDEFRLNSEVYVMIANRRAGGIGVNLVEASYSIVYSRNFSLGDELQSEARNYRSGSEMHEKITKINLVAANTIDALCLNRLQSKEDVAKSVIDLARELTTK